MSRLSIKSLIDESSKNDEYLTSYLVQCAYIESLTKFVVEFYLSIENLSKSNRKKVIFNPKMRWANALCFLEETNRISHPLFSELDEYRKSRNLIVHDLINKSNYPGFKDQVDKQINIGELLIKKFNSLEKIMDKAEEVKKNIILIENDFLNSLVIKEFITCN